MMTNEKATKHNIKLAREKQEESKTILEYCANRGTILQQDMADVISNLYTSVDCLIDLVNVLFEERNKKLNKDNVVVEQVDLDEEFGKGFTKELSEQVAKLKKQGKLK